MAGSMYQSPNGTWVLRVHTGRDPLTGKKRYRARSFRGTQRDAGRALAAFVTELDGSRPGPADKTFGELLDKWYSARSSDWSPSTAQQTRWMIDRRLSGLHGRKVSNLGTEDLDLFMGPCVNAVDGEVGRSRSPRLLGCTLLFALPCRRRCRGGGVQTTLPIALTRESMTKPRFGRPRRMQ